MLIHSTWITSLFADARRRHIGGVLFFDQELISHRYTHLVVVVALLLIIILILGATSSKSLRRSVVSNRIGMKFCKIVLQVLSTRRLTESDL